MKKNREKKEKKPGFWKEFKAFISKGNVLDLAIAVVLGAAFNAIVQGFVNGIINPLLSLAIGKASMEDWVIVLSPAIMDGDKVVQAATLLKYGAFLQAILNFLIIGLSLFVGMKIIMHIRNKAAKLAELAKSKLERKEEEATEVAAEESAEAVAEAVAEEKVEEVPAPAVAETPAEPTGEEKTQALLAEIRDLLKNQSVAGSESK